MRDTVDLIVVWGLFIIAPIIGLSVFLVARYGPTLSVGIALVLAFFALQLLAEQIFRLLKRR